MDIEQARRKVGSDKIGNLKLRKYCQRRAAAMLAEQNDWKDDWRQTADYIDPTRGLFDGEGRNAGSKKRRRSRHRIINGAAAYYMRVAVAGMSSHMTSKSSPWFTLSTPDTALANRQDVKAWLQECTELLRDTLAKSNFYKAMPVVYQEDMLFGVAAMMIAESSDEVARFHPLTVGSYAIAVNGDGKADTLYRFYTWTVRQIVDRFGKEGQNGRKEPDEDSMPKEICRQWKAGKMDQPWTLHALAEPNPDARPGIGPLGVQAPQHRPYREVTWIEGAGSADHGVLEVGGHYEAPFVAVRWNPVADDLYSSSPGQDSLGDVKQLQYLEGQKLRLIDMIADPPKSVPDTMQTIGVSLMPGATNYMPQSEAGAQVSTTYTPDHNAVTAVANEIEVVRERISQAFFYNLFMMLDSLGDKSGRTATEIAQRSEEKAAVLGPTLEIVTDEGLDPIVIRVYRMMERAGRIPPPPEIMADAPIRIEYTSILAQAMKAAGSVGIERTLGMIGQIAQVNPDALDKLDVDAAIDSYANKAGAPAEMVRDTDAVQAIRAQRAQQAQMAQMAAMAQPMQQAAGAAKELASTVPQEGSLADAIMGGGA